MNENVGKRGRSIQEAKECMHDRIECCSICNGVRRVAGGGPV